MSRKCDCGYGFRLINRFGRFEVYKCLKCGQLCIYRWWCGMTNNINITIDLPVRIIETRLLEEILEELEKNNASPIIIGKVKLLIRWCVNDWKTN